MKKLLLPAMAFLVISLGSCTKQVQEWLSKHGGGGQEPAPVIANADFEKAIDFNNLPANAPWVFDSWMPIPSGNVAWGPNLGRNNSGGISIQAPIDQPNDIRVYQRIAVDPGKYYKLTAWVKTENVSGGAGANICAYGTWWRSESVMGTTDWHQISMTLPNDSSGSVLVGCRLGFWAGTSSGKAYFDDLAVSEFFMLTGKHVQVVLDPQDASAVPRQVISGWVANLDKAYLKYGELMGGYPYSGNLIAVLSVSSFPGGWAVAGNPIQWYEPYIKSELESIQSTGTWSFGIMHELGHDFVLPNSNTNWIFDEEMFANFRMYYVVEKLNATIVEGKLYHGTELENYYKTDAGGSYANGIAIGVPMYHDGLMYTLLRIKDLVGWAPIKAAMADLNASSTPPGTKWAMFNLFLDKITRYAGQDVRATYPAGELNTIHQLLDNE